LKEKKMPDKKPVTWTDIETLVKNSMQNDPIETDEERLVS
jgi:hypothetical protein